MELISKEEFLELVLGFIPGNFVLYIYIYIIYIYIYIKIYIYIYIYILNYCVARSLLNPQL